MGVLSIVTDSSPQNRKALVIVSAVVGAITTGSLCYTVMSYRKAAALKAKERAKAALMPSPEEQQRRLSAFASKPFREEATNTSNLMVPSYVGPRTIVDRFHCKITIKDSAVGETPVECLDLTTYDYHSFSSNPKVVEAIRKAICAYGVGSCGPRGFYGTVKPHMLLEKDLATFLGTEDAVIYSFSYATIATLLSCFAAKGDFIVMDEAVGPAVADGCDLTRAKMISYRHNDMDDLERCLKEVAAVDVKRGKHRRLIVTEGVFGNTGQIADIPHIKTLSEKYQFRIILDDSNGFGALGKTGRGTLEHFGLPISAVDAYIGSMSTATGGVGGFCAGPAELVNFQRLGATAYVFSASLPPYVSVGVSTVLEMLTQDSSCILALQKKSSLFRKYLREAMPKMKYVTICGSDVSPIVVIRAEKDYRTSHGDADIEDRLQKVANTVEKEKVAIARQIFTKEQKNYNEPSLRIVVKSQAEEADLKSAAAIIGHAITTEFV